MYGPAIEGLEVNGAPVYNKNPLKEFFRTGKTLTNTLSAQGGSDKSNYFVSYSYLDQEGTVPTTSYKRHSAFAKYHNAFTDKLSATFQFNFVSSLAHRVPEGYDLVSPVWTVYTAPHTWNPRPYLDANGDQRMFRYSRNNPYWVLDNVSTESRNNRFLPVVTLAYNPAPWLTVTERLGADMYSEQGKYHESPSSTLSTTGIIRDRTDNFRQFNHDLIIEARKQVGEDLGLSLLLGNNVFSTYWQQFQIEGTGIAIENFNNVSNSQRQVSYETHTLTRKVGFYAQANVEYKQMLNLSLTGRYDGSSVLAKENRYYPYGSASLGFIFSELLKVQGIDFGKLRVSYSSVGNDNIGAYSLTTPYKTATNFPFNGQNGFLVSTTLGNPNLINEKTNEFETGLEMKVLGGRIGFEVSYFQRKHLDLLTANVPIAPSSGYSTTTLNAGDMTNKGIEALLNLTPVNQAGFRWDVTLNYTRIRNKVIEINESLDMLNIGQTFAFRNEPYGTIYNYDYERDAAGRIKIDATGLPMLSTDLKKIGNIQPDWIGGMLNTLRYKNTSLSFFFDMRKGGDVMNSDNRYGLFYGTPKTTENREPRIVEGVLPDGSPNNIMVDAQDYYQRLNSIASASVEDITYIKLRNVSLGYELPLTMLSRSPFAKASLSVTGRNLWFYTPHFTGSDPEVSSYGSGNGAQGLYAYNVPTSRSFNFTLAVTLK
jgi:TonB-linked SusC/RagA family outer membrane protein